MPWPDPDGEPSTLRERIEAVRDRAVARLSDAHDYHYYTVSAWRTLGGLVANGSASLAFTNPSTGSGIDGPTLIVRAQRYVAEELASATLQQFVTIFETFVADALRLWLVTYPQSINRRQLSGEEILALSDKAAIVDALVAKELAGVFYDRPAHWFRYLNARVAIGLPTPEQVARFAEVKATRDVLVHGQGIATPTYVDKAGPAARAAAGDPLDVPAPYHHASWQLIRDLTNDIGNALAARA